MNVRSLKKKKKKNGSIGCLATIAETFLVSYTSVYTISNSNNDLYWFDMNLEKINTAAKWLLITSASRMETGI